MSKNLTKKQKTLIKYNPKTKHSITRDELETLPDYGEVASE